MRLDKKLKDIVLEPNDVRVMDILVKSRRYVKIYNIAKRTNLNLKLVKPILDSFDKNGFLSVQGGKRRKKGHELIMEQFRNFGLPITNAYNTDFFKYKLNQSGVQFYSSWKKR